MAMVAEISQDKQLQALLKQGFVMLSQGRIQEAATYCKQVLKLKPDLVQGHFLVGLVALEAKDRKTALHAFGSVVELEPRHAAAWAQLAKLFISDGQASRADAALAKAIENNPTDPVVQDLVGTIYSMIGEYGLAREWFEKATSQRADHVPFMLNLANNLVYHGQLDEAEEIFNRIIKIQPDTPQAHWALAGTRKAKDRLHLDQMQRLVGKKGQHPRAEAFYYYGIGKELEDLQQWDEAFEAFSKGARARRQTVEYDEAGEIEMFRFLQQHFTREWLEDGGEGYGSTAPVFVLGQPRTGTTLVERIISSHSQVSSAGELQQFGLAIRRLSGHQDPRRFSKEFFEAALGLDSKKVGGLYIESSARMAGNTARFIDKLPQNYLHLPLILKALPNAKIIHLTRNPMDACFASFKQLFADAYLHSYDLEEMARHHCRYRDLMDRWREQFPGRFYDISYEETVHDLETNVRQLLRYLELPWEDACLNFHRQKSAVSTASASQVREPAHTRSVDRWRKYERQLQPMLAVLKSHGLA